MEVDSLKDDLAANPRFLPTGIAMPIQWNQAADLFSLAEVQPCSKPCPPEQKKTFTAVRK
jgi:hypothetical protein